MAGVPAVGFFAALNGADGPAAAVVGFVRFSFCVISKMALGAGE